MCDTTLEPMKKNEEDPGVLITASEERTSWIVNARVPWSPAEGTHYLHHGIKYVTGSNEGGNVLDLCDLFASDACSVKPPGPIETIDEFVKIALTRIPAQGNAVEKVQEEGCGTSCG